MRRLLAILTLVALCFMASAASADKGKKKKPKKTDDEIEKAERERLQNDVIQEAPSLIDWFRTFWEPKLKINAIDTTHSPELRLRFSVLGWNKDFRNIAPLPELEKLLLGAEIFLATGEEKRPKSFVKFGEGGAPPASGPAAKILAMDKAGIPLDVVVVAAGHVGYKAVDGLEEAHKKAIGQILAGVEGARANLIWHGPMLYTYRAFEGIQGELSRFDESLSQCEGARLRYKIDSSAPPDKEKDEKPPALPPCGLLEGIAGPVSEAVGEGTEMNPGMPFRGRYSRLFDIYRPKTDACVELEFTSTAIANLDLDSIVQRTEDRGAFEEALRLLLRYGRPGARREIIILGDGRDGFLDDEQACRDRYTERECAKVAGEAKGKAAVDAIRACVQSKLDGRATSFQERFAGKVPIWLALLRAADIRVHAIAYNMSAPDGTGVSQAYERERLELLALQTGGSYREVVNRPSDVANAAQSLLDELSAERVVLLAADLPSQSKGTVKLTLTLGDTYEGLVLESQEWTFGTPFMPSGLRWKIETQLNALRVKVGPIWYWVILVGVAIFALFLLWMFLKLIKKMVMAIVGAIAKKGKGAADAAKKAGKGAGDVAGKAGKGLGDAAKKAGKGVTDAAKKSVPKGK